LLQSLVMLEEEDEGETAKGVFNLSQAISAGYQTMAMNLTCNPTVKLHVTRVQFVQHILQILDETLILGVCSLLFSIPFKS